MDSRTVVGMAIFGRWVRVGGIMRDLKKNQRKMYYALYSDRVPILDKNGDPTLEYATGYTVPVEFKASVSAGRSDGEYAPFGMNVSYDRTISTVETDLPIDEHSIIWLKNEPIFNDDGSVDGSSADYEVAEPPLDGLNSLVIAIKKR